jgi:hypothetical protein
MVRAAVVLHGLDGAARLRRLIGQKGCTGRITSSPGSRWCGRRSSGRSGSPEFVAAGAGEDDVVGVDLGHLSSIPPVG